jgi:hypothetical protein
VDRYLFGAHVTGTSDTKGKVSVKMVAQQSDAVFTLHFKGTTTTQTVATRFPVEVFSSGTANFDVQRPIHFNGLSFTQGPATIETTYSSSIDGLPTPPGLRGCIVRSAAMPRIRRTQPQGDAIALSDTKAQVLAAFDKNTDKLVKELNQVVPWEKTLALFVPRTKGWVEHLGSTKDYILASPGPKESTIPALPKEAARMRAPIELWIHGKPENESARKLVDIWNVVHFGFDRFRLNKSPKIAKVEGVALAAVGEWWVVKIGEDLLDSWIDKADDKQAK